jgi:hypothetical protein
MAYESVDQLQKVLVDKVFHYAKDARKRLAEHLARWSKLLPFIC